MIHDKVKEFYENPEKRMSVNVQFLEELSWVDLVIIIYTMQYKKGILVFGDDMLCPGFTEPEFSEEIMIGVIIIKSYHYVFLDDSINNCDVITALLVYIYRLDGITGLNRKMVNQYMSCTGPFIGHSEDADPIHYHPRDKIYSDCNCDWCNSVDFGFNVYLNSKENRVDVENALNKVGLLHDYAFAEIVNIFCRTDEHSIEKCIYDTPKSARKN